MPEIHPNADLSSLLQRVVGRDSAAFSQIYELWLVGDVGPVPAGLFRPDSDDSVLVEGERGSVLAVTEEPAGGSEQPTGEILLSTEL